MNKPSEKFIKTFGINTKSKTDSAYVFEIKGVRFSVLTSRMLRVESGVFTDMPTQAVYCRCFDTPRYEYTEKGNIITITTEDAVFCYNLHNKKMQAVTPKGFSQVKNFYKDNLYGTYRTLDMVNGARKLDYGIMSKSGVSRIDDSKSLILNKDGTISERENCKDEYYLAYGHDYRACLKDFYLLCGNVPLVPRYCLGNWWSRYKAYTQEEYTLLMKQFIQREIPITVATIDMDWHWVDVVERFGKEDAVYRPAPHVKRSLITRFQSQGWTGYSWNTELFPNYRELLSFLHENGFHTTVNLHPAQGVRPFEDMYEDMARAMGIDPKTKEHIAFDIANPKFTEAYFDILHKPYEKDGVDFWWIDWQQEKNTKIKGLDPLWALNHYHTLSFNGENKRPLILSRYAEIGSHRYPLGFSGDTAITWKSLDFQPYFTANATNAGYTWWSHDIGGHTMGARDDEMYARWVQLGLYSPINRLHSTSDEFMGKEPWKYSFASNMAATNALKERNRLIPYIYSMNYRTHSKSIALCEPMYYSYPEEEAAYQVKNQYFFGSELIVAPITKPISKITTLGNVRVWLPEGKWTDIYTGYIYSGNRFVNMYRGIESIPVLAKEGAILPLDDNDTTNDCANPEKMTIRIFLGNGSFELYEDDGETLDYKNGAYVKTEYNQKVNGEKLCFTISAAKGELSLIPKKRSYTLIFENISDFEKQEITLDGNKTEYTLKKADDKIYVFIDSVPTDKELSVAFDRFKERKNTNKKEIVINRISGYQMKTVKRKIALRSFVKSFDLSKLPYRSDELRGPVEEIMKLDEKF